MSVTDEIKERIDIVDLVSESVELRRTGKNYTGFCPFHANTRTPSFVVFPDTQTWHCFGECSEGGDVFNFLMKQEGLDFPEALRRLAERTGVQLRPLTPEEEEEKEEHERLRKLLEDAVLFYRHNLLNTEDGKEALAYIHQRGMTEETIESYGLGYAPNSWEATSTYFQGQGYAEKDLIEAGLASERDSGGLYDRFRNRLMIPIRDRRGRMTGFGARTLDPDGVPKYLNSPQTDLFDKSKLLYGLDQARKAIRAEDQVIIVEGYLGVLIPHQHGFKNIVATMGTALTDDHLYKIKRYSKRIILAMDSDAAGVKATLRGLDVARETLDKETEFAFDARGLLRRESKLQADLRVATLPPGMDPDDVVNENPERWQEIIEQAQPILIHVMETLAEGRDLQDPKVKSEIAGQVLPLIDDVSNAIERDTYIQRLARMLEVDERTLLNARPAKRKAFRRRRPSRPPASRPQKQTPNRIAAQRKGEAYEAHCVGILLRHPELTYQVNRRLGEFGLARVSTQDFHQTKHQMLMELIQASLEQNEEEPGNYILNNLTSDSMDIADDLLSRTPEIDLVSDKVLKDLIVALLKLRRWHVEENNTHIRFLFTNEQIDRDAMSAELRQNTAVLHKIDLASQKYTSRTATVERK